MGLAEPEAGVERCRLERFQNPPSPLGLVNGGVFSGPRSENATRRQNS
jgi:hypothetical protein